MHVRYEFEAEFWNKSRLVAGTDEAGRGPLAGPVCAAAVVLHPWWEPSCRIDDSKKLSEKERHLAEELIQREAMCWAVSFVDPREIDRINILQASIKAMNLAADQLSPRADHLLVDGNRFHSTTYDFTTIVKGDSRSLSIAAASILAKCARDRHMRALSYVYPDYGFETNVGYPTTHHIAALKRVGPCEHHRQSFIRKYQTDNALPL